MDYEEGVSINVVRLIENTKENPLLVRKVKSMNEVVRSRTFIDAPSM